MQAYVEHRNKGGMVVTVFFTVEDREQALDLARDLDDAGWSDQAFDLRLDLGAGQ